MTESKTINYKGKIMLNISTKDVNMITLKVYLNYRTFTTFTIFTRTNSVSDIFNMNVVQPLKTVKTFTSKKKKCMISSNFFFK